MQRYGQRVKDTGSGVSLLLELCPGLCDWGLYFRCDPEKNIGVMAIIAFVAGGKIIRKEMCEGGVVFKCIHLNLLGHKHVVF